MVSTVLSSSDSAFVSICHGCSKSSQCLSSSLVESRIHHLFLINIVGIFSLGSYICQGRLLGVDIHNTTTCGRFITVFFHWITSCWAKASQGNNSPLKSLTSSNSSFVFNAQFLHFSPARDSVHLYTVRVIRSSSFLVNCLLNVNFTTIL